MGNKFEKVKHILLDAQAATAGVLLGDGIFFHNEFEIAGGLVLGAFGAQTIHVIQNLRRAEQYLDVIDHFRQDKGNSV